MADYGTCVQAVMIPPTAVTAYFANIASSGYYGTAVVSGTVTPQIVGAYGIGGTGAPALPFTGIPTYGQVWPRSRTQVVDGTPPARQTATFTTSVLASQDTELGSVNLGKSFHLIDIATTAPARVRLYTTTAARVSDLPRSRGTNPDSTIDHGVILEFASAPTLLSADLSPVVVGHDGETYPDGLIPYAVANLDPTNSASIRVTITFLPLAEWEE